jgi:hypothetical protein
LPAALLVVWQVANAAGFFWEWASQPQRKPVRQSNPEAKIINPRAETDRA